VCHWRPSRVALVLNYKQTRETGRQAGEASKQVQFSTAIIRQEAYRQLTRYGTNFNAVLFGADEDLLALVPVLERHPDRVPRRQPAPCLHVRPHGRTRIGVDLSS
jgi:hypothetical protein